MTSCVLGYARQAAVHEKPPPTAIVSPVIQPEAADARNTATDAMSSGCPRRPSAVRATICRDQSGSLRPPRPYDRGAACAAT
jgi:hypothetical protein